MAEQEKKVSIVIPVYNAEKYLGEALESLLAQTYRNWEAILVVSRSGDQTEEVVEEYLKRDLRISRLDHEGQGISSARNQGISLADGEYLLFMDADDYLSDSQNGSRAARSRAMPGIFSLNTTFAISICERSTRVK